MWKVFSSSLTQVVCSSRCICCGCPYSSSSSTEKYIGDNHDDEEEDFAVALAAYKTLLQQRNFIREHKRTAALMKEALKNTVILHSIIVALDFPDLLVCRRVNQQWKAISSKILLRRDSCVVKTIYFGPQSNYDKASLTVSSFHGPLQQQPRIRQLLRSKSTPPSKNYHNNGRSSNYNRPSLTLEGLTSLLNNSVDFPATTFTLYDVNLSAPEVDQFFRLHGHKIRTLQLLKVCCDSTQRSDAPLPFGGTGSVGSLPTFERKETFKNILLEYTPNLESLIGGNANFKWSGSQFVVPKLKKFTFINKNHAAKNNRRPWHPMVPLVNDEDEESRHSTQLTMAYNIISAAPNLKLIDNFQLASDTGLVTKLDKIHLVKELVIDNVCTWSLKMVDKLRSFCEAKPQIKSLHFDQKRVSRYHHPVQASQMVGGGISRHQQEQLEIMTLEFESLFKICSQSLQHLQLTDLIWSYMDKMQIPELGKLKSIQIGHQFGTEIRQCFPHQISLAESFPNLRRLDLRHLCTWDDDSLEIYFPSLNLMGSLPTVKLLDIPDDVTSFWILNLGSICPNFTHLNVHAELSGYSDYYHHRNKMEMERAGDGLDKTLPRVFEAWPDLEEIHIFLRNTAKHSAWEDQDFPHLDSALTGFLKDTCARLLDNISSAWASESNVLEEEENGDEGEWGEIGDHFDDEFPMTNPSLTVMKKLKRLDITFYPECHRLLIDNTFHFTVLSGLYVFKLMEDLTTTIYFDHNSVKCKEIRSYLQPLEPFVNFRHVHLNAPSRETF